MTFNKHINNSKDGKAKNKRESPQYNSTITFSYKKTNCKVLPKTNYC